MSARNQLIAALISAFLSATGVLAQAVQPVDLSKPVTNPRLVEAIRQHQRLQRNETATALFEELRSSVLLVPIVHAKPPDQTSPTQLLFKKGDQIVVVDVRDKKDSRLLALFTDHIELRRFTGQANSAFVMPSKDAMAFVLEKGYSGLVINPASEATLRMDTPFIRTVIGKM